MAPSDGETQSALANHFSFYSLSLSLFLSLYIYIYIYIWLLLSISLPSKYIHHGYSFPNSSYTFQIYVYTYNACNFLKIFLNEQIIDILLLSMCISAIAYKNIVYKRQEIALGLFYKIIQKKKKYFENVKKYKRGRLIASSFLKLKKELLVYLMYHCFRDGKIKIIIFAVCSLFFLFCFLNFVFFILCDFSKWCYICFV